jgi:hypothetical protein
VKDLLVQSFIRDNDGFIYFNELLYKTMKRRYANGRTKKKVLMERGQMKGGKAKHHHQQQQRGGSGKKSGKPKHQQRKNAAAASGAQR